LDRILDFAAVKSLRAILFAGSGLYFAVDLDPNRLEILDAPPFVARVRWRPLALVTSSFFIAEGLSVP
jgi:hypothetical protein